MLYKTSETQRRRHKKWRDKNPEKIRKYVKEWKEKNQEKWRKYQKQYNKKWVELNRDKVNAYNRNRNPVYRLRTRKKVFNLLGGEFCVLCGCSDIRILEINHINGGGSQQMKQKTKKGIKYSYIQLLYDIKMGRLDKKYFNVMCRVCNVIDYVFRKYGEESIRDSYINTKLKLP